MEWSCEQQFNWAVAHSRVNTGFSTLRSGSGWKMYLGKKQGLGVNGNTCPGGFPLLLAWLQRCNARAATSRGWSVAAYVLSGRHSTREREVQLHRLVDAGFHTKRIHFHAEGGLQNGTSSGKPCQQDGCVRGHSTSFEDGFAGALNEIFTSADQWALLLTGAVLLPRDLMERLHELIAQAPLAEAFFLGHFASASQELARAKETAAAGTHSAVTSVSFLSGEPPLHTPQALLLSKAAAHTLASSRREPPLSVAETLLALKETVVAHFVYPPAACLQQQRHQQHETSPCDLHYESQGELLSLHPLVDLRLLLST